MKIKRMGRAWVVKNNEKHYIVTLRNCKGLRYGHVVIGKGDKEDEELPQTTTPFLRYPHNNQRVQFRALRRNTHKRVTETDRIKKLDKRTE